MQDKGVRDFAAAWDAAFETGTDRLEDELIRRALEPSDACLIFALKGRRPQRWRGPPGPAALDPELARYAAEKRVPRRRAERPMETNPDADVLKAYETICGYDPNDPSTDQGGVEQHVLACWLRDGIQTDVGTERVNKLGAYFEIDPRNIDDIKRVINGCGVC